MNYIQTATKSEKETIELGKKIAQNLHSGEILALEGQLGAGKTTLIKGIAKGLGIKKPITSPTFLIMKVYRIKSPKLQSYSDRANFELRIKNFVHVDAYRIKNPRELIEIGIKEFLGEKDTVVVIEWADKVRRLLGSKKVIWIKMRLGKKENERKIEIRNLKLEIGK